MSQREDRKREGRTEQRSSARPVRNEPSRRQPDESDRPQPSDLVGRSQYQYDAASGPENAELLEKEAHETDAPLASSPEELGERFLERATGNEPAPLRPEELTAEEIAAMPDDEREALLRKYQRKPVPRGGPIPPVLNQSEVERERSRRARDAIQEEARHRKASSTES